MLQFLQTLGKAEGEVRSLESIIATGALIAVVVYGFVTGEVSVDVAVATLAAVAGISLYSDKRPATKIAPGQDG